ncbi:sensor histidine kinase [Bradyrhizobium liaoningense]|uniref:PAS domain-containing sensor histidine kinase n=1 Tax=Bradyrhizobium liaoningense TaxID=43992 RepID=UPI001BA4738B|nr:sensor histidine kinase [Bradyrhizobium liaoningense]MBR0819866.1 sensor histidine kinase [Bradyrhizobium liaoningense]
MQISNAGQFFYASMNPAFERALGISISRETAVRDCMSEEDAKAICDSCDACLAKGKSVHDRHRLTLGGRRREFDTTINPVRDSQSGNIVKLVGSHRVIDARATGDAVDRTAKRRATAELELRLLSLQEEVQQRIASDLHDSTCQHLIAASLTVMRLRRAISDNGSVEKLMDDIDASIDQAQREIRAFTYLLHPRNLSTDGLKLTIEQFVGGFSARTSLKTSLQIAPEVDRLSYERQRAVLRVIQEALANVFRHAQATHVNVAMEATDTHFKLQVADNGRGMPTNQARSGPKAISFGVGIPAMRARLRQLGGTLEIHSSSAKGGRGTTLCADLPHGLLLKRARQPVQRHGQLEHHRSIAGRH